jgi:hypothetical protein
MADNHFRINRGLSLVPQATAPANPVDGDIYYDSVLQVFRKYSNGAWSSVGSVNGPASSTDNALARFDGATGLLIKNSGIIVDNSNNMSGIANLSFTGKLHSAATVDSATTGSGAALPVPATGIVELTNSSLTSIDTIVAGGAGQMVILTNRTGASVTLTDESSGTAANRIRTGTGKAVTMKNNASLFLVYSDAADRWLVVGGTGGDAAVGDLDVIDSESGESASLTDFTQNGLELLASPGTPASQLLHGLAGFRLTHQGASTRDFKKIITVNPKFRGYNATLSFDMQSTADSANLTLVVRDETNSTDISASQQIQTDRVQVSATTSSGSAVLTGISNSNLALLKAGMAVTGSGIPAGTKILSVGSTTVTLTANASASATVTLNFSAAITTRFYSFQIPDTCQSISWKISALAEAGSPESYFDDIVLRKGLVSYSSTNGSLEVPVVRAAQDYTPIVAGFSSLTNVNMKYRQIGDGYHIQGSFTANTAASQAQIGLPSGLAASDYATNQVVGRVDKSTADANTYMLAVSPGQSYMVVTASHLGGTSPVNANSIAGSGTTFEFNAFVRIAGLSATEKKSIAFSSPVSVGQAILNATSITTSTPIVTEPEDWTPTGSWTTNTTYRGKKWRVGDRGFYEVDIQLAGAPSSGALTINMPSGEVIDAAKLAPLSPASANLILGDRGFAQDAANASYHLWVPYNSTTVVSVRSGNAGGSTLQDAGVSPTSPFTFGSGDTLTVKWDAPIVGWEAEESVTTTIPLSSAVLVNEQDTALTVISANGYGSTANKIVRFSTVEKSVGSDVQFSDSATQGSSFTVLESGVYSVNASCGISSLDFVGISRNSTQLTTNVVSINAGDVLALSRIATGAAGSNSWHSVAWSGYLNAGDVLRLHTDGTTLVNTQHTRFSISKQGKLTQVNVSSDQKIEIPTHELRFEGASARGGTDTDVIKFDSLVKLRGDGFEVINTAANGTRVQILKAGILSASTTIHKPTSNTAVVISKNQAVLTGFAVTGPESLSTQQSNNATSETVSTSITGISVVPGDIIRVVANTTPTADATNNFTLMLQEQKVAVALSNVLPQFTESDSAIRVTDNSAGYGATNTFIRRFSTLESNLGTDITYADSASLGASFTVNTSGIYHISYTEINSTASMLGFGISRNASGTTNVTSLPGSQLLAIQHCTGTGSFDRANCSWQGYLNKGDIIRAHTNGTVTTGSALSSFNINKVGKPNITGVDVTPFVNIPYPVERSYLAALDANMQISTVRKNTLAGEVIISNPATLQLQITAVRACTISATCSHRDSSGAAWNGSLTISYNGVQYDNLQMTGSNGAGAASGTVNLTLNPGDTVRFTAAAGGGADNGFSLVTREAPDTVIAQNKTFNMASLLATRVTTTPAAIGEYRTRAWDNGAFTLSDVSSGVVSPTNGMTIYTRDGTAGVSAGPNEWQIFVGKNKSRGDMECDFFGGAGKTLPFNPDVVYGPSASFETGVHHMLYDPNTGVLTVRAANISSSLNRYLDAELVYKNGYFDVRVAENPLVALPASTPRSEVTVDTGNGHGSTNTRIRRFTNLRKSSGTGITYADSATLGGSFTINEDGVYTIVYSDCGTTQVEFGISVDATGLLATGIGSVTYAQGKRHEVITSTAGFPVISTWTGYLRKGQVVRAHTDSAPNNATDRVMMTVTQVSK